MQRPEINALPCGEWLTEKTRNNIKAALIILPILVIIASIFSEIDFLERKKSLVSLLLSIPPEVYESASTILAIFIINKIRLATATFYRPLNGEWMAIMAVMALSAVIDLASILEDSEFGIAVLLSMICLAVFGAVGIYLAKNIDEAYSGKIRTFSLRLRIASIVALFTGITCIPLWQKARTSDGTDEQYLMLFFAFSAILGIVWVITFIRALFSGLDLLHKGAEQGWTDAIYAPDNIGRPTESQGITATKTPTADRPTPSVKARTENRFGQFLSKNRIAVLATTGVVAAAAIGIGWTMSGDGDLDGLFADIEIPEITPQEIISKGGQLLYGIKVYEYDTYDDNGKKAEKGYGFNLSKLVVTVVPDDSDDRGIPIFACLSDGVQFGYDDYRYVIGYLQENTLTLYQANQISRNDTGTMRHMDKLYIFDDYAIGINTGWDNPVILKTKVDNFANFTATVYSGENDTSSSQVEFYDELTFNKLLAATPTSIYEAENGLTMHIQLLRAPKNANRNVKAIVIGQIINLPPSMTSYDKDCHWTILYDNNQFELDSDAQDYDSKNFTVKWSKNKLIINDTDPLTGANEIVLKLKESLIMDNAELNETISELEDESLY